MFTDDNESLEQPQNAYEKALEKYLNGIKYFSRYFDFIYIKWDYFSNMPPDIMGKSLLKVTVVMMFCAMTIFLVSCQAPQGFQRISAVELPQENTSRQVNSRLAKTPRKQKQELFIKRQNLSIKSHETGSSTGSIWADSNSPQNFFTEFKPSRLGDIVTITIPEELNSTSKDSTDKSEIEPLKIFKMEIVGLEAGGDVYLRGQKNFDSPFGESRSILIMAKIPYRVITNSEINARDLTQVALTESSNQGIINYTATGWDATVSKKLSGFTPEGGEIKQAQLAAQKQELDTLKKALEEQKKALSTQAELLKKDRERMNIQDPKSQLKSAINTNSNFQNTAQTTTQGTPLKSGVN